MLNHTSENKIVYLRIIALIMIVLGLVIAVYGAWLYCRSNQGDYAEGEIMARSTQIIRDAMDKKAQEDVLAVSVFESINMFRSTMRSALLGMAFAGVCLSFFSIAIIGVVRSTSVRNKILK